MKYLWQQIIAFLAMLVSVLGIASSQIEKYLTQTIIQNHEERLLNYGENIVSNNFSRDDLVSASQLLASDSIEISVFLPDGAIIYPTYDQRFDAKLTDEELAQIQSGKKLGLRKIEHDSGENGEEPYMTVYLPHVDVGEFPAGFIGIGAPMSDLEEQVTNSRQKILKSILLASGIGVILSVLMSAYQTRKIQKLQTATREIADGNYGVEIDTSGRDEFGDLARDFKYMADSLEESKAEVERQENVRSQFMMDLAHEMKTPLTTISGLVEGLQYKMIPENQIDRSLELVQNETKRLTRLVNESFDYEKMRSGEVVLIKDWQDLDEVIGGILQQLNDPAQEKDCWFEVNVEKGLKVWADPDRLRQIIINLVNNAIQFSSGSAIEIRAKKSDEGVLIEVEDHGIGIKEDEIDHIWERFYKADVSRKASSYGESGIGLTVVKAIVEAHGGKISVESTYKKGSTFKVFLPDK